MKYKHYIFKRKLEGIFIFPFITIGKLLAKIFPLKNEYDVFFFFPFYHTGGAEKVHALITQTVKDKRCIVFFTKKSVDNTFLQEFKNTGATIKNISTYTDNKWLYFNNLIFRGIVAGYINTQKTKPIVFNGQCNFGYKLSPWVSNSIKQIELIHSYNSFSFIRIPFLPFISQTVMISKVRIENHLQQYTKLNIPQQFAQKIQYICNGINLPNIVPEKNYNNPFKVIYVGRGTSEKRVHIVATIAQQVLQQNKNFEFTIVGDVNNAIPTTLLPYCTFAGNVTSQNALEKLYQQAHILLITSNTEGFPMVVMEAMANGCTIMATPVGDLPIHITANKNGFITSSINEDIVVQQITKNLLDIYNQKALLHNFCTNNIEYSKNNFAIEIFNAKYKALLSY